MAAKTKFPRTVYVSIGGSGEDSFLAASKTAIEAIRVTEDETTAVVAEYKLVSVQRKTIVTTVEEV